MEKFIPSIKQDRSFNQERPIKQNYNSKRDLDTKKTLIKVLKREAKSILDLANNFPDESVAFVEKILNTSGRVVFSGMGKSGHVGRKLVATFSSMGTPSIFLHPSEALHGDLGMVNKDDLFVALSKSGTGKELEQIINVLQMQGNKAVLICCRKGVLANFVDLVVQLPFEREACEMNLAPTSSSTLMIAFGDAVSVTVSKSIGFEQNDFARTHPAGALGKRLLCKVRSFMHAQESLPFIKSDTKFQDLIVVATEKKLGIAIVADDKKNLEGIVTDGDLRRACKFGKDLFSKKAGQIMTKNPKTVDADAKAYEALQIMEKFNITSLVVKENGLVVGVVHIHDLVKAGIKS